MDERRALLGSQCRVGEFPVRTDKNQMREHEEGGMVCCVISQEDRALTLLIFSNFGMGFKSTLLPERSLRMAYPLLMRPLMKYSFPS